jgi:hypothetical protein
MSDSLTHLHARKESPALRHVNQLVTNRDAGEEVGSLYYHRTIYTHVRQQFHNLRNDLVLQARLTM